MKKQEQISEFIERLTQDSDTRQELWVQYLNGASKERMIHYVMSYRDIENDEQFKLAIWKVLNEPDSSRFQQLISSLTEFEQSVAVLLALGLTVEKIAIYKDISPIRIRQAMTVIRYNSAWRCINGT
jgi:DNA-directed RNA polymerase specialized sigma24 family protein